jgi:two-component system sensor histidine kinase AgrC
MIKKYLNILFYMFSFIFIYYLLVSGTNYEILPSLLIMVIVFIDIAMYIADEYESSIITEKQKAAVYLKDLENQKENVEAIEQRNLETERRNHDLKKNIRLIKDLMEKNQYGEAREYICKLEEKCSTYFSYRLYSKHSVINSLLNSKIEFCQSNGVDVKCFVCGKIDGVDDVELYCLLVNLLDNAIAAAMLSEKPYISIFLNCSDTEIYGEFINTIKTTECSGFEDLIPENNKDGHGYGLLNICEIVKNNNGEIDFLLLDSDKVKVTFKIKKKVLTTEKNSGTIQKL